MKDKRLLLTPLYIVFLIVSYFYVSSVLEGVPVSPTDTIKDIVEKTVPVTVYLKISGPGLTKTYTQVVESNDSIAELLVSIRMSDSSFIYEKSSYTYGNRIDQVLGVVNTTTQEWKIYDGDEDITSRMDSLQVKDGSVYSLNFEKI